MALIPAVIAWFLAQFIKCFIDLVTHRETSIIRALFGSGGMPSSHSSTICAITTYIVLTDGITSPVADLAIIVSFIVMYDAMNVRRETGRQGKYLNDLEEFLTSIGKKFEPMQFKELVGHTPLQVVCGMLLGIVVGFVYYKFMW